MGSKKAIPLAVATDAILVIVVEARAMDGRLMRHVSAQVVTMDKIFLLSATMLFLCSFMADGFANGLLIGNAIDALRRNNMPSLDNDDGALIFPSGAILDMNELGALRISWGI